MARRRDRSDRHRITVETRQRESVKPLELFFDLVFVLGFTQCTALMTADPMAEGIARGLLALAVLWWSWTGFAWLTSVIDPEEGAVRLLMFAASAGLVIVALCLPEAFGDRAVVFAVAYSTVRLGHLALYLTASREDRALHHSVLTLVGTTSLAIPILIVAAFFAGTTTQVVLWALAVVLDFGGPAVVGIDGWRLVPAHFAERHGLVIILALGESIVALGVGARLDLTAGVLIAAVLGLALAAAFWWTYFDVVALVTERRLSQTPEGAQRNRLARDSYSYLHFPMVAGIVLAAFGLHGVIAHADEPLHGSSPYALLGGVSVYLLAHVALRLRNAHTINRQRLVLAVVLLALIPVALVVPALGALAGLDVLIWVMIAYEHAHYDDRRYRLRHGLDPGPIPGETPT
jgi:low temperature requirement protein LtrA